MGAREIELKSLSLWRASPPTEPSLLKKAAEFFTLNKIFQASLHKPTILLVKLGQRWKRRESTCPASSLLVRRTLGHLTDCPWASFTELTLSVAEGSSHQERPSLKVERQAMCPLHSVRVSLLGLSANRAINPPSK